MASEGTVWAGLRFAKGAAKDELALLAVSFDVAGTKHIHGRVTVDTTGANLPLGDITNPGMCIVVNRGVTNAAIISTGSGGSFLPKVSPGRPTVFEINGTAVYAKAAASTTELEYLIVQL
jgi:hypothetical protein